MQELKTAVRPGASASFGLWRRRRRRRRGFVCNYKHANGLKSVVYLRFFFEYLFNS